MSTTMFAPEISGHEEPDQIAVIEYRRYRSGWKPFAVIAGSDHYDFDWCEQDKTLAYHLSGSGGDSHAWQLAQFVDAPHLCAKLWYDHTGVGLTYDGEPIGDKDARKLGYQVIAEPLAGNPFEDPDAIEGDTEYCEQCRDRHPYDSMCRHVQYEEWSGFYLGCGAPEVDFRKTQASLYRLLRMLAPEAIDEMLNATMAGRPFVFDGYRALASFIEERNYEERYWPGIAWLISLDRTCKEALALTAGWLWMYQRDAWQACLIVPDYRFVRHLTMRDLKEWLAIDPFDPSQLRDRPLRVRLGFEPKCANDFAFLAAPQNCHEVLLWPPAGSSQISRVGLTLSVAEVKYVSQNTVEIYFGAVIERNGQHVSEMEGYRSPLG